VYGCLFFFGDPHQDCDQQVSDKEFLRALLAENESCETCDRPERGTCPHDPKDLRGPLQYNLCVYHSRGQRLLPSEEVEAFGGAN
jgi:hypothetical protein